MNCQRRWRENHAAAMEQANEHMDAVGVPDESLVRGLANVQMACSANPILEMLMQEMYPGAEMLMQ